MNRFGIKSVLQLLAFGEWLQLNNKGGINTGCYLSAPEIRKLVKKWEKDESSCENKGVL